jgi:hypothetical protein
MDLSQTTALFSSRALVIGQRNRGWGMYEIATVREIDDGSKAIEVDPRQDCFFEESPLLDPAQPSFYNSRPRVLPMREADWENEIASWSGWWVISVDDVVAFIQPNEIEWVHEKVEEAYSVYMESDRSQRSWDTFQVMVRLLV